MPSSSNSRSRPSRRPNQSCGGFETRYSCLDTGGDASDAVWTSMKTGEEFRYGDSHSGTCGSGNGYGWGVQGQQGQQQVQQQQQRPHQQQQQHISSSQRNANKRWNKRNGKQRNWNQRRNTSNHAIDDAAVVSEGGGGYESDAGRSVRSQQQGGFGSTPSNRRGSHHFVVPNINPVVPSSPLLIAPEEPTLKPLSSPSVSAVSAFDGLDTAPIRRNSVKGNLNCGHYETDAATRLSQSDAVNTVNMSRDGHSHLQSATLQMHSSTLRMPPLLDLGSKIYEYVAHTQHLDQEDDDDEEEIRRSHYFPSNANSLVSNQGQAANFRANANSWRSNRSNPNCFETGNLADLGINNGTNNRHSRVGISDGMFALNTGDVDTGDNTGDNADLNAKEEGVNYTATTTAPNLQSPQPQLHHHPPPSPAISQTHLSSSDYNYLDGFAHLASKSELPVVDMEDFFSTLEQKGILRDDPRIATLIARYEEKRQENLSKILLERDVIAEPPQEDLLEVEIPEHEVFVDDGVVADDVSVVVGKQEGKHGENNDATPGSESTHAHGDGVQSVLVDEDTRSASLFDRSQFLYTIDSSLDLIEHTLSDDLIVPDFPDFVQDIQAIYESVKTDITSDIGAMADYIPQLATQNPDHFGVSICTVDGQRASFGDSKVPFCLQSCSKPLTYSMALEDFGADKVHEHVGREPSGTVFNALILNPKGLPHNPLVNSGAIMCCGLVLVSEEAKREKEQAAKEKSNLAAVANADKDIGKDTDKDTILPTASINPTIDHLQPPPHPSQNQQSRHKLPVDQSLNRTRTFWSKLTGNKPIGYDDDVYQSEAKTADRNFALAYFMNEHRAFPKEIDGKNLRDVLQYYFKACSLTLDTDTLSIAAATLANGGVCPLTNQRIMSVETVKNTLSLMYSCGMYDYSGEFAFTIGLPAKSGVAGGIFVVIPNLCGFATFSPNLDKYGNSVRGVEFLTRLTKQFSFHILDHLTYQIGREDEVEDEIDGVGSDGLGEGGTEIGEGDIEGDIDTTAGESMSTTEEKSTIVHGDTSASTIVDEASPGESSPGSSVTAISSTRDLPTRSTTPTFSDASPSHAADASPAPTSSSSSRFRTSPNTNPNPLNPMAPFPKKDPRKKYDPHQSEMTTERFIKLAALGDLAGLRRLKLKNSVPASYRQCMDEGDYDRRTPLHLAASNGHLKICRWLLEEGHCLNPRDRWGNTPLDDAVREGWDGVERFLRGVGGVCKGNM